MDDPARYLDEDSEYPTVGHARPKVERLAEAHTWDEWRKVWIARGICPRSDHSPLDEGLCPCCGWTIADEKPLRPAVQDAPEYLPTLPGALTLDECSPNPGRILSGRVDEEAA